MTQMDSKKKAFLSRIIEEYIKTAKPVGSKYIVEKCKLDISPATARNYMAFLEEEGFITAPHTSAGRIPTEKGYSFYIANFLKDKDPDAKQVQTIDKLLKDKSVQKEEVIKNIAKTVADLSEQAVVLSLSPNSFFYTGISNILKKPEFADLNIIYDLGDVVDQLDEVMSHVNDFMRNDVEIYVGKDNPFSDNCSAILTSYSLNAEVRGVIGILGPVRMDYSKNYSIVKYLNKQFN
ncbi:hypothetical protein KKC88_06145 [Patescibacteria group bacterium]|nr:hypothetical protein [Patescibacteria group bacterium]MBU1673936.1 hypothetical protein [Patescibacteria group bacterium]MBU1963930.1 hypothetical protein [Patescibacteria group bacterium]